MPRYVLSRDLPVVAQKEYLGSDEDVIAEVIAAEFYPKSVPTFTIRSRSGHLYAYLPPQAFGFMAERDITELVDIECPESAPSVSVLPISGGGFGRVNRNVVAWQEYLFSADWADENLLVHCVKLYDGTFAFLRNSRFQIGGKSWTPPEWKKLRREWRLSNRDACVIVRRGNLFLGVSRKGDFTSFGLPAGKIEPHERPLEGAARELGEETGLALESAVLLDERQWRDRYIYCYAAEASGEPLGDDALKDSCEGVARWVEKETLFAGEFGEYNRTIFDEYKIGKE